MQHEFDLGWDNVFEKYEKDKNNKLNSQKRDLDKFNELIYEKELNKINNIKLKQNNKIKLLENQERLSNLINYNRIKFRVLNLYIKRFFDYFC